MNELQEIIENSSGKTREVLLDLIHKVAEFAEYQRRTDEAISNLRYQNRLLRQKLFDSSSEKLSEDEIPEQSELEVFDVFSLCATQIELSEQPPVEQGVVAPAKPHPKKKPLPKHLPRKVIEHDLSEQEKQCQCGNTMECIGADVKEKLEYQRPKLTVLEHRCKKYGCATCNQASKKDPLAKAQIKLAAKPAQIIPIGA